MNEAKSEGMRNEFTITALKTDLKAVINLVDTFVKVHLIKNCFYVGFVHSVDPVTMSIILSVPKGDAYQTVIIPGHAVLSISNEDTPANIKPPQKKETQTDSADDILERKTKLISWFKKNLLPVTELDDKIVIGNVSLLQPFTVSDISTDNPIVAMQIRNVIERMPEDFELK